MRRLLALPVLLLFVLVPAAQAQSGDLVRATDLYEIRQLGSVAVSPDGRTVAYTVRQAFRDGAETGYRNHVWSVPLDGSAPARALTHGASASQPQWHPGGRHLAFVRTHEGQPQVFVLPLAGGEPFAVTAHDRGASAPRWSPDGTRLLFSASIPAEADSVLGDEPVWPHERPMRGWRDTRGERGDPDGSLQAVRAFLDQNDDGETAVVINRTSFQGEFGLNPTLGYSHLYVVPVDLSGASEPAEADRITDGFYDHFGAEWLHDDAVVYGASRDPGTHPDRAVQSTIWISEGGLAPRELLTLPGHSVSDPTPSPDGSQIAFTASRLDELGYQQTEIGVMSAAGAGAQLLTEAFDRSAGAPVWSATTGGLFFSANADGTVPLFHVMPDGGAVQQVTSGTHGVNSFDVGPEGVAYSGTHVGNPYELYAGPYGTATPPAVTDHNARWLQGRRLAQMEAHQTTVEGRTIDYWTMRPPNWAPGQRVPLLVEMHGGPSAMWGPGEDSMWHEFQFLAARGYGIVFANPRGSGGYGRAFRRANYRDWGVGPAADVLAAVDEALQMDWVDPARTGLTGGSYAGYLTAWIVAHDSRFDVAVAQRGVYDLETFLGEGNAYFLVPTHFGLPWESPEAAAALEANSPINFVDQITTPLLIMHASQDLRTGVIQSEMLYRSLKLLEREVEYVRYPGAGHDLSRTGDPAQRVDRMLRIYEFIARYAPPGPE